jgi:taurine dioxygenase
MYDAYDALSLSMKRYLDGMTAVHSADGASFEKLHIDDQSKQDDIQDARQTMNEVEHPVVRTHPVTGRKALYVNAIFTERLRSVPRRESKMVLDYLVDHIKTPEFSCRFRWQKNSIAFWDNRCTQHYAIADYGDSHRLMHRVTINGDRPV